MLALGVIRGAPAVSFQARRSHRILARTLLIFAQASPQAACGTALGPPRFRKNTAGELANALMGPATVLHMLRTVETVAGARPTERSTSVGQRAQKKLDWADAHFAPRRISPDLPNLAACGLVPRQVPPHRRVDRDRIRTARPPPPGLEHSCHVARRIRLWLPRLGPGHPRPGRRDLNPACDPHFVRGRSPPSSPTRMDSAASASAPNSAMSHLNSNAANCDSRPRTNP